ncbi:MAG: NADH:flavin oxidoreductase [Candidatus Poseidoniales archaeon]|jgi:2,4-dienoyl-CoA reductase-like NADH-dependent reductase (Old Yellow Enzyme family)|nr:NADH:flavin oxidoreductase [Candidatus Poseidoniales archaeon]|tara:strand:+ start:72 stop:1166 length:1095 start_codon:yes stop_codon:yes gene_type:complete
MKSINSFILPRSGKILKNRTVLAAMTNKQSHENGVLSEEEKTWLIRRAMGDFAITTTAATNVTEHGRGWVGEMGVWGDHQIPELTNLASELKKTGTISLAQLFHGGMRAPQSINGVQPVSASQNTEPGMDGVYTRALKHPEIHEMIQSFTDAAIRCQKAGLDGVELHGAHSYLICQFLGKITNRREDEWGGNLKGRSKFLREIINSIRKATGPEFLIGVRISPIIEKAGIYLHDSLILASMLSEMEIDMIHISCWDVFQEVGDDKDSKSLTKRFSEVISSNIPLISTGAVWTAKDAQYVLDEGADLVGVARVGLAHPDWPTHLGDISYSPTRPPFSEEHLREVDLSPAFVDYMRSWKNFVIGGK